MRCARCHGTITAHSHCLPQFTLRLRGGIEIAAAVFDGLEGSTCRDCGVLPGSVHHGLCCREDCSRCGAQLYSATGSDHRCRDLN